MNMASKSTAGSLVGRTCLASQQTPSSQTLDEKIAPGGSKCSSSSSQFAAAKHSRARYFDASLFARTATKQPTITGHHLIGCAGPDKEGTWSLVFEHVLAARPCLKRHISPEVLWTPKLEHSLPVAREDRGGTLVCGSHRIQAEVGLQLAPSRHQWQHAGRSPRASASRNLPKATTRSQRVGQKCCWPCCRTATAHKASCTVTCTAFACGSESQRVRGTAPCLHSNLMPAGYPGEHLKRSAGHLSAPQLEPPSTSPQLKS